MNKKDDFNKFYAELFQMKWNNEIVDKDATYMYLADKVSKLSSCDKVRVGCVILTEDDIPIFGTNIVPEQPYCDLCVKHAGHCTRAIHAEISAIGQACRMENINLKESTMYLTHAPCWNCSLAIIAAGISKIIYKWDYLDDRGDQIELLEKNGVKVEKY
jgi:dCMP deaminase